MRPLKTLIITSTLMALLACGDKSPQPSLSSAQSSVFIEQLNFPLKIKDIGLGVVRTPCEPKDDTYVDILQKPVRLQLECTIGTERDSTDIVFASDRKTVVRVTRNQYLNQSDPEPLEILKAAINFYGEPDASSGRDWLVNYGNAYRIIHDPMSNMSASAELNDSGIGLLIKGYLCADGNWRTVKCGSLGTRLIKYDLIDVIGYRKQMEDGKARLSSQNKTKLDNQKF